MKKIISFLYILMFFLIGETSGQSKNMVVKDIVMPSPDAASMGKFTDIPVDYSTGVANISVPIHTISYGPISASVSLSYHSGGVKLGEPATWVGLNWSLNAGGMISRTVQGLPDDGSAGYASQSNLPNTINSCETGTWDFSYASAVSSMTQGTLDLQPDIFNVSYPGGGFKFYITHDQKIVKINKENDDSIRFINISPNIFAGFEIMSSDGTKYIFGKDNASTPFNVETTSGNGNPAYITSWLLSKVQSADLKYTINYSYTDETYETISKQTRKYTNSNQYPQGFNSVANRDNLSLQAYNKMTINGKRIASISSAQDVISFHANTVRLDIANVKRLDSISCNSLSNSNFCKRFAFGYDYFEDPNNSTYAYSKRLQLKQIQEKSCDQSVVKPPYVFEYEGILNPNGKIFLPQRLTHQIDHWGFYNGKTTNESIEVNIPSTTVTGHFGQSFSYGGANRNVDTSFVKRGTLKKIVYPTGGNTEFTYEPNIISEYTLTGTTYLISNLATCVSPNAQCCGMKEITSGVINLTQTQLDNTYFTLNGYRPSQCTSSSGTYNVHLRVYNGTTEVGFIAIAFDASGSLPATKIGVLASLQANTNYTFKVTSFDCRGELNLYYNTYNYLPIPGPGIRVKQMTFNEGNGLSTSKQTTFDYMNSGNMTTKQPRYANVTYDYNNTYNYSANFYDNNIAPVSDFTSNIVRYSSVKIIEPNNGFTINSYYNSPSYPSNLEYASTYTCYDSNLPPAGSVNAMYGCGFTECALAPFSKQAGKIGKILSSLTYNSSGQVITSTFYNYNNSVYNSPPLMVLPNDNANEAATLFNLESSKVTLSSQVDMINGVTTVKSFNYDALNRHSFPVSQIIQNSDGNITKDSMRYVFEITDNLIRDSLKKFNIISNPHQTLKYIKVGTGAYSLIDGTKLEYSWFHRTTGVKQTTGAGAFPRIYKNYRDEYTWNSAGVLSGSNSVLQSTIDSCDAFGNIAKLTMFGWQPMYYTWNGNGTMKSKKFQSHINKYSYYPGTALIDSVYDIDGQVKKYEYDKLWRINKIRERNNNIITEIAYNFRTVSDNMNWMRVKKTITPVAGSNLNILEEKQYLDGLGRPLQTVKKNQANSTLDLVVGGVVYDNKGRVIRKYQPYQSSLSTGAFVAIPINHPFDSIEYEASPLNRQSGIIPAKWHKTSTVYSTNLVDEVKRWVGTIGYLYDPNTLNKVTTTDASGRVSITFTDKKGRTILQRQTKTGALVNDTTDTYSIYDDKDRISKIIPPGATPSEPDLLFTYLYDQSDNLITKKVPGKTAESMVYNDRDLVTFYKDGNLGNATYNENATANQWMMTKYDLYGRPTNTGFLTSASTPSGNNDGTTFTEPITSTTYGTAGIELGKVKQFRSLILGNYISSTTWIETNNFYDNFGRVRYVTGNNHLNTALDAQCHYFSYDLADNVLYDTLKTKNAANTQYTIINKSTYDYLGRPSSNYHKIDALPEKHIHTNAYNFRGELTSKSLGFNVDKYLQKTDFAYNTQGWLTAINGPLTTGQPNGSNVDDMDVFYLKLGYDSIAVSVFGQSPVLDKSGNISQMVWQDRGGNQNGYFFDYDFISRVSNAKYFGASSGIGYYNAYYNEFLTYDVRGNIKTLARNTYDSNTDGSKPIDNLTYTYTSNTNMISKIADPSASAEGFNINGASASATYLYDLNGNLYQDPYKKLDFIKYFHNNMPKDLTVNLGTGNVNKIRYTYDASGMKLRKQVFNNGNTSTALMDYVQGIEYNNGAIEAIPHSDGRVVYNGSTWRYEFNVTDHLGNVRAVISDIDNDKILDFTGNNATHEVVNAFSYYPFGMVMGNYSYPNNTSTPDTKYQYNGKEFNSDLGLNLLDYGARWYDPAIGRFTGVDPLASAFNATSAYVYTLNNPINMIDPDGRAPDWIYDQLKDGSYKKREGASNDGGSTFHTYNDRNGNTHYFNQKENTFVTIKPGQIDKAIADRKEKTRSVVRKTGEVINNVGDGIAAIGYVAAPFTEGASLVVAGVGEGVSLGGKAITNSANFEESGATTKNMVNLGVDLVTVLAPLPLENLVKKSNLDDVSKKIIRSEIGKVTQTTEFVVKKEIEDNK